MLGSSNKQNLISTGNETLDKFLGGGLLNSTLNLYERQGPSSKIIDVIINKSIVASSLTEKKTLLYVNFNTSSTVDQQTLLSSLPSHHKVKPELLYKDIRLGSRLSKIKIAWRYSTRGTSSPSDAITKVSAIDFGVSLTKTIEQDELGKLCIINIAPEESLDKIISNLRDTIVDLKKSQTDINVVIKDIIHPFSPLLEQDEVILKFMYALRCLSRLLAKGCIVVCYDSSLWPGYSELDQQLFNLADSVVSFHSYETDENVITGYKDIDGTMSYVKVPKINSLGFSFQHELSDWGYRLTKDGRFFVVEELSLPPCEDNQDTTKTTNSTIDTSSLERFQLAPKQMTTSTDITNLVKEF